jgi:DNA adenine methylase
MFYTTCCMLADFYPRTLERGDKNKKCEGRAFYMILRRLGNKQAIAEKIQTYFPAHKIYIEPFFGAGGMFFNKRKAKYNIVNDIDSNVFNLFNVVMNQKTELLEAFEIMPIHQDLHEYWKQTEETEPIKKALRFIFLSNFSFLGTGNSLNFCIEKPKQIVKNNIDKVFEKLQDVMFMNCDFREMQKNLNKFELHKQDYFWYADPPYLGTLDNYSNSFTEKDAFDLFEMLNNTGCKFAISEFDNDFVMNQAKERKLNIIYIGERTNLKNKRTEILITNYENAPTLFS